MFKKIVGFVYILGDDINTDDIVPNSALTLRDTNEVAKHTLEFIDPQFVKNISKYNILIAGENFGTGSSREEAVNVFKDLGIKCVIARSFARIYFRNLINLGIPGIHLNWSPDYFSQDDKLEISLSEGVIFNITKDLKINFEKLPKFLTKILEEGGIINQLRKKLLN
ncbi:MAG: Isopropylmalate/citramalate isomerase small subunit [Candidatus Lokiarchaeum sp. GC14_75]|nr:MAG: Isopropylmalate/citramalate isomerase small subunit [Candidatus Lokiarchaeum sp. GC14_75]